MNKEELEKEELLVIKVRTDGVQFKSKLNQNEIIGVLHKLIHSVITDEPSQKIEPSPSQHKPGSGIILPPSS